MSIIKKEIETHNGKKVYLYTLDNGKGLKTEIYNFGGIIKSLVYEGTDVVLGRDTFEEYQIDNDGYFGALIGRNSNRIENSEFELNGKTYKLFANNGRNNLHGGKVGFDKKIWNSEVIDSEEPSLILTLVSPDGEEGFPGEVSVKVTYTLTKDNAISIHYEGESNADTILNMTNHTYFNLNGHASGVVDGHTLWIDSDFYTPNTEECMPFGEIQSVKGTPFDFKKNETLGEKFVSDHPQIKKFKGIDHNIILNGRGYRKVACLKGDKTDISMDVCTDRPGVQVYTGNVIDEERVCKENTMYKKHGAVCLETQVFPNSMKHSHYPDGILKKGEKYETVTTYKFYKEK